MVRLLFFVLVSVGAMGQSRQPTASHGQSRPILQPTLEGWQAKWIATFRDNGVSVNTWMRFINEQNLSQKPTGPVMARIATDSKYWLWSHETFQIMTQPGPLTRFDCRSWSVKGLFDIGFRREASRTTLSISVPGQTQGLMGVPKPAGRGFRRVQVNGKTIWTSRGKPSVLFVEETPTHLVFRAGSGTLSIIAE